MATLDKDFPWDGTRAKAALLVAHDELSDEEIAKEVGVHRATLANWKNIKEFQNRVAEHLAEIDRAMMRYAISKRRERIKKLQKALDRVETVIDARAEAYAYADEEHGAGAESGLLVSKPIFSHSGELRYEWKFDAALVREYRALMEQAAKELGQLSEKLEVTGDTILRQYVGVDTDLV